MSCRSGPSEMGDKRFQVCTLGLFAVELLFSFLKDLINYFLTVLHLCCCIQAFSSCSKQGLLFVAVGELLIAVASLVSKHSLQAWELQ